MDVAPVTDHQRPGADAVCPVCRETDHVDVLTLSGLPVLVNAQVRPDEAAGVACGDVDLVVCRTCGHLFNRVYDSSLLDYDATYENTLHYSAQFRDYADELCRRLVSDHHLVDADVAELGSGPGHFLSMLGAAGVARAVGYDPSYDAGRLGAPDHPAVALSSELFPDDGSLQVRLAFSQHVLEHLDDPVEALVALRSSVVVERGVVYTEVPNGDLMIRDGALWDLIYEHRSYFTATSLAAACTRAGLRIVKTGEAFGGQFLWCDAVAEGPVAAEPDQTVIEATVERAQQFGREAQSLIASARDQLAVDRRRGPIALWGAGSKGMTWLNLVATDEPVDAVVDINPRKTGWGVPGTHYEITAPDHLVAVQPATVLVANPIYLGEIDEQLRDLGVEADVRALWGDTVEAATC